MHATLPLLKSTNFPPLTRRTLDTLQVNLGYRCNQACHHCHVNASPDRKEMMSRETVDDVLRVIKAGGIETLDITGGAPELNPHFRHLVREARAAGIRVIDRCNLTVLNEPGFEDLAAFLAAERVEVTASLPCYTEDNVDKQRGRGVFDGSIRALQRLNALGYGRPGSDLRLDLVYNPLGAFLPGPEAELAVRYRDELGSRFGIEFHDLYTLTNMPISRFAEQLRRTGEAERYMGLLVNHFNPATVDGLMCRHLVSVGWDGALYDCDFNQMLELPIGAAGARSIWELDDVRTLADEAIVTGPHCFGCTAGAGSSCGGSLV